jgi:hypothetical protein
VIDLVGIGGNLATEPTAQATNITITDLTTYGYDVSFSAASPNAENYIVTRGINAAFLAPPVDGQTYVKGDYIDAFTQVVHVGPAGTFRPTFVVANTEYNFNVFAFNGPVGYQNYLTDSPLMGTVNTPATMMGNYYQGLDASSAKLPYRAAKHHFHRERTKCSTATIRQRSSLRSLPATLRMGNAW